MIPRAPAVLGGALVLLLGAAAASLVLGSRTIAPAVVLDAVLGADPSSPDEVAISRSRLPRTAVAAAVGATLGLAGTVMQALSRNPLAEPGLLGVSWGAAAAAVTVQGLFGLGSELVLVLVSVGGASVAGTAVVALGLLGRGGPTPERLVVAGAAISGLLAAVVQGVLVLDRQSLELARRWLAGSLAGTGWDTLLAAAPVALVGALTAFALARRLTAIGLGDDVAAGLGVPVARVKLAAAGSVVALAGVSVALAGPIMLVGLVVPHLARRLAGHALVPQLVLAALLGAALVLGADVVARLVIAPEELPVGVVCAIVGAPVLAALARGGARR